MPYYKTKDINLLFIHIPKTGGTSVDKYLLQKYNIKWNNLSLHTVGSDLKFNNHVLQHVSYQNIIDNNNLFNIDFNNLKIITITRNPYHRFVSALFYNNIIKKNTPEKDIDQYIKYLLEYQLKNANDDNYNDKAIYDNHFIPQYKYLCHDNKLCNNLIILQTENLNNMMHNIGYRDFNSYENINQHTSQQEYFKYITNNTLEVINKFYKRDFELFNYKILTIDQLHEIKINL